MYTFKRDDEHLNLFYIRVPPPPPPPPMIARQRRLTEFDYTLNSKSLFQFVELGFLHNIYWLFVKFRLSLLERFLIDCKNTVLIIALVLHSTFILVLIDWS